MPSGSSKRWFWELVLDPPFSSLASEVWLCLLTYPCLEICFTASGKEALALACLRSLERTWALMITLPFAVNPNFAPFPEVNCGSSSQDTKFYLCFLA
jgi:hypothetical protein